jgi:hypothetical protein
MLFELKIKPLESRFLHAKNGKDLVEYSDFLEHVSKQLPDFSSFDFTKNISIHADIHYFDKAPDKDNAMMVIQDVLQRNVARYDNDRVARVSANKFVVKDKTEEGYNIQIIN